jgi:hypothetical protein
MSHNGHLYEEDVTGQSAIASGYAVTQDLFSFLARTDG